jgi:hypothetical protein
LVRLDSHIYPIKSAKWNGIPKALPGKRLLLEIREDIDGAAIMLLPFVLLMPNGFQDAALVRVQFKGLGYVNRGL